MSDRYLVELATLQTAADRTATHGPVSQGAPAGLAVDRRGCGGASAASGEPHRVLRTTSHRLRSVLVLPLLVLVLMAFPTVDAHAAIGVSREVWAACGTSSPPDKVVRVFPRPAFAPGPSGQSSALLCGTQNFGYRHVSSRHGQDWQNIAVYTGENWRDLTDFAIEQVLTVPQPGYPRYNLKNDTWAFKAPLEIRDGQGQVRAVYYPVVVVAGADGKIVTAYPTRDPV